MNKKNFPFICQILSAVLGCLGIFLLAIPSSNVNAFPPADSTPVPPEFKNAKTLRDPCEKQPNNLIKNGTMGPDAHDTPLGSFANEWNPFPVPMSGAAPSFRVAYNEGIDGVSQQIYGADTFDHGILQTVYNTQPGTFYWVRWGYSLAAKSGGSYGPPNVRVNSIGRKIGADPYGGIDPKSPNVIWGPDLFDGNAATNALEMILLFPARADHVTIFLRAIAREGGNGENRVWIDAVCMEPRFDLGQAPAAPPTITPTPLPTATPRPNATRVPPTRTPTRSVTPPPSATRETVTEVSLAPVATRTAAPNPVIRARPTVAAPGIALPDLETDTLVNLGLGSIGGSIFFFITGLILARYAFR